MKYCKRCLYPENHPLGLTFDAQGVCSGCRIHEEKDRLDWAERMEQLRRILRDYRSKSRSIHDCVIPVSGGRDSYFIVHTIKNVLGLNPLLVTYNKHYNTGAGIRNIAYLQSLLGCDIMTMTVSPERIKRITRETLRLRGSMYWHCLAGQTVFPVRTATQFKIPLIIWGAHQGLDQVGMFSHLDEIEMTRKYRKEHDLMGLEAEDLLQASSAVDKCDLEQFFYPSDKEIESVGVRGIYLGNYIRWDSKAQHEEMIRLYGYETLRQQRTFDTYNDVDCFHYSGIHDYIKMVKCGYGRVTDHACREIRLGRMSREQGISMVQKFRDAPTKDLASFLDWIGLTHDEFSQVIEAFRDHSIWSRVDSSHFVLRHPVESEPTDAAVEAVRLSSKGDCVFLETGPRERRADTGYILMGRGWVDDWNPPHVHGRERGKQ